MYRFEKLRVYQDALVLVETVYKLVAEFPKDERFALSDQLKRSSTSIVLNIAEGTGGLGDIEFKNFLRHSLKSLYETVAAVKLAKRLFHIEIEEVLKNCEIVGKELNALIKSLSNEKYSKQNS